MKDIFFLCLIFHKKTELNKRKIKVSSKLTLSYQIYLFDLITHTVNGRERSTNIAARFFCLFFLGGGLSQTADTADAFEEGLSQNDDMLTF